MSSCIPPAPTYTQRVVHPCVVAETIHTSHTSNVQQTHIVAPDTYNCVTNSGFLCVSVCLIAVPIAMLHKYQQSIAGTETYNITDTETHNSKQHNHAIVLPPQSLSSHHNHCPPSTIIALPAQSLPLQHKLLHSSSKPILIIRQCYIISTLFHLF